MSQIVINDFLERANVECILWDHAGVLVNNEPVYGLARSNMFRKFGYDDMTPEKAKGYLGFGEKRLFQHFQEAGAYPDVINYYRSPQVFAEAFNEEYRRTRASITDYGTLVRPGLSHLLCYALKSNIPMAIVSNSNDEDVRQDAGEVVKRVSQRLGTNLTIDDVFPVIMTANTMTQEGIPHKPEPDCYKEGYRRLKERFSNLSGGIERALICEDSWTGQQAAVGSRAMMLQVVYAEASDRRACCVHPQAMIAIPDECGDFRRPYLNRNNPKVQAMFPEVQSGGHGGSFYPGSAYAVGI